MTAPTGTRSDAMPSLRTTLPGEDTMLACWSALAQLSERARLIRTPAAVAAVFPTWAPLNNAILHNASDNAAVAAADLASLYVADGVDGWAVWLRSIATDLDAADIAELDGFTRDTTTLVMHTILRQGYPGHAGVVRTSIATVASLEEEPIAVGDLDEPDPVPDLTGWAIVHDGLAVAAAWSYLHNDDLGIYGVETVPGCRRRGFARALMLHIMADGAARGARTASLQSTAMGQPLYQSLGFAAAGRYEEWVPARTSPIASAAAR
jgi:ribosomal protein S18 acetylase RimI-like enzyme